jgi:hypothetical protein
MARYIVDDRGFGLWVVVVSIPFEVFYMSSPLVFIELLLSLLINLLLVILL